MRAHPGRRPELLELLRELVDAAADEEPGTLVYVLHETADDPDTVVTYELFADDAALEAHKASPAVAAVVPRLGALVAERSFRRLDPTLATGVPSVPQRGRT
jgi:quinol monooxygenase YgiN